MYPFQGTTRQSGATMELPTPVRNLASYMMTPALATQDVGTAAMPRYLRVGHVPEEGGGVDVSALFLAPAHACSPVSPCSHAFLLPATPIFSPLALLPQETEVIVEPIIRHQEDDGQLQGAINTEISNLYDFFRNLYEQDQAAIRSVSAAPSHSAAPAALQARCPALTRLYNLCSFPALQLLHLACCAAAPWSSSWQNERRRLHS